MKIGKDAIYVAAYLLGMAVAFALSGLKEWALFILSVAAVLGLWELYSIKVYGKTLSQRFWEFKEKHIKTATILLLMLVTFLAWLILHLWR